MLTGQPTMHPKGLVAAGNFLEQDCGRVAAVIRAALVAVGRCFCCWERWTCGHLESAATLKARRRSCRSARASHSLSTCSRSSALLFHFPIILFCSGFLAALLEKYSSSLSLQDRAVRMFVPTSTAVSAFQMVSSTTVFPSQ